MNMIPRIYCFFAGHIRRRKVLLQYNREDDDYTGYWKNLTHCDRCGSSL